MNTDPLRLPMRPDEVQARLGTAEPRTAGGDRTGRFAAMLEVLNGVSADGGAGGTTVAGGVAVGPGLASVLAQAGPDGGAVAAAPPALPPAAGSYRVGVAAASVLASLGAPGDGASAQPPAAGAAPAGDVRWMAGLFGQEG